MTIPTNPIFLNLLPSAVATNAKAACCFQPPLSHLCQSLERQRTTTSLHAPASVTTSTDATATTSLRAERTTTFGMGCFWAPSEDLLKTPGVISTVAGYTGNGSCDEKSPPSYDSVCYGRDWVEAVRVTYDDSTLSYADLLDAFFEHQNPKYGSRQYSSIIFPSDETEKDIAEAWLSAGLSSRKVRSKDRLPLGYTSIEYPPTSFYKAEGYHQNYWPKWRVRLVVGVSLLAISSGALHAMLGGDADLEQTVETAANSLVVAGGLAALAERLLDAKVVKMN